MSVWPEDVSPSMARYPWQGQVKSEKVNVCRRCLVGHKVTVWMPQPAFSQDVGRGIREHSHVPSMDDSVVL